jgi:hypothetical protein
LSPTDSATAIVVDAPIRTGSSSEAKRVIVQITVEDVKTALTTLQLADKLVGQFKGYFSKKQKQQIAKAGASLIRAATDEEINTYDTPQRQQVRRAAGKVFVAKKKRFPRRGGPKKASSTFRK